LQQQLKQVQNDVKTIDAQREKLAREAGVEEHKVKESIARLKELGITDAAKLSVADLEALRTKTKASLESSLATVTQKVTEANAVLAEYDATIQA
jgi:predicted transcriptional regulator